CIARSRNATPIPAVADTSTSLPSSAFAWTSPRRSCTRHRRGTSGCRFTSSATRCCPALLAPARADERAVVELPALLEGRVGQRLALLERPVEGRVVRMERHVGRHVLDVQRQDQTLPRLVRDVALRLAPAA